MDISQILAFLPLYVVGFISLYSLIAWGLIFESRKQLSDGYIKTFATRTLVGVVLVFLVSIWIMYINLQQVKDLKIQLMNYGLLVIMVTFITWVAISIHKLSTQFGFKVSANNIIKYIDKDKKNQLLKDRPNIREKREKNIKKDQKPI